MSGWPENLGALRTQSSMDYWWPRLREADVPVPETVTIPCDQPHEQFHRGVPDLGAVAEAGLEVGGPPAFLRTDQASDKHSMASASKLPEGSMETVREHVYSVLEHNELADLLGLPYNTFYVREWLDLWHRYEAFEHTPIAAEVRWYLLDGEVYDKTFYWPVDSIVQHEERHRHEPPLPEDWRNLHEKTKDAAMSNAAWCEREYVPAVAEVFNEGYWSLDFAFAEDGDWYAIDMARGEISFHPEGVEPAQKPEEADL